MRTTRVRVGVLVAALSSSAYADPDFPVPTVIREATPGQLYYRIPSDIVEPMMRNGVGIAMRPTTMDHPGGVAFTFELLTGTSIQFGRGSSYGVVAEVGYAYSRFHDHLAIVGIGPSWRGDGAEPFATPGFAIIPHVVAGAIDGHGSLGVRTSLVGHGWLPFELAHQVVYVDGQAVHEIQLMLAFTAQGGGR